MKTNRVLLAAILLIGALGFMSLLSSASSYAGTTNVTENLRGETVLLPEAAPEKERLVLVSFLTITAEAEMVGAMAIYDDPQTDAKSDYLELYDQAGGLLSVIWVDRFGIRIQEETLVLDGVLVLLTEGTPL